MKCFSREWSKKAGEMERRLKNYLSTALVLQQPGREKPPAYRRQSGRDEGGRERDKARHTE